MKTMTLSFCGMLYTSAAMATVVSPTVTIPGVYYQGVEVTAYYTGPDGYIQGYDTIGPTGPPADSRGGEVSGSSAYASYSSLLSSPSGPMITASSAATGSDSLHPNSAATNFTLDYYFVATGPSLQAVVDLNAMGFGNAIVGSALAQETLSISPVSGPGVIYTSPTSNWTANTSFSVYTNEVYAVQLYVQTQSLTGNPDAAQSATVTIDPRLTIDPSNLNASQYGLFFSEGVSVSAVPEPATIWLMVIGMGAMGLMIRQRKAQSSDIE